MTEPNIVTTTLEAYADRAEPAPADLLDVVEDRYRRRRRGRAIGSAVAVVLVVAVVLGGVVLNPFSGTANHRGSAAATKTSGAPISAAGSNGPLWRIPGLSGNVPTIPHTWPAASFSLPAKAPDGGKTWPMGALDGTHVLILSQPTFEAAGALYSFDTATKTFSAIVSKLTTEHPAYLNRFAIAPNWLVWEIDGKNSMDVYKVARAGGTPQLVSHVATDSGETGTWTATDQAIYWSSPSKAGVMELALSGGQPKLLAGFGNFQLVDGSAWAVRAAGSIDGPQGYVTQEIKNVLTGQDLPVTPFTGAASLTCSPTFCIGTDENGHATIQNLSDTKSAHLPAALAGGSLCNCGNAAVYIGGPLGGSGGGFLLWTPSDGKVGASSSPNGPKGASTFGWFGMQVLGWQQVAGGRISEYVSLGAVS